MTRIKWDFSVSDAKKITKMSLQKGQNHGVDTQIHIGHTHQHKHTHTHTQAHSSTESTSDLGTQYIQVLRRVGTVSEAVWFTVAPGVARCRTESTFQTELEMVM